MPLHYFSRILYPSHYIVRLSFERTCVCIKNESDTENGCWLKDDSKAFFHALPQREKGKMGY